jgi:hypothetical protein
MTKSEVIMLRNYIKGAYGYDNGGESTDAVWFDLLQEYEYKGIMQAAKNHIKSGNNYPPRVAELIRGYELILDTLSDDIINRMERVGEFDDMVGDEEIRAWNKRNRIDKLKRWLAHPNRDRIMPSWLQAIISKYQAEIKMKYFGNGSRDAIEQRSERYD